MWIPDRHRDEILSELWWDDGRINGIYTPSDGRNRHGLFRSGHGHSSSTSVSGGHAFVQPVRGGVQRRREVLPQLRYVCRLRPAPHLLHKSVAAGNGGGGTVPM